ncbi:unnamed protein product [Triticum turgidum subsp. durum]|uniref:FLZ-type domain-containing protein n=1 Tax=Triticum turgidum subsp. durum TaxID=4567 RepID=A0A9R1AL82_TRITD|nr:unnamed protein product [Triticum turgidum subsp. durum]
MRRTTSLTEVAPPSVLAVVLEDEDEDELVKAVVQAEEGGAGGGQDWLAALGGGSDAPGTDWLAAYRARAAPARAGLRRNSADYSKVETAAFLRHCGLCRRLLGPGRDTFMFQGRGGVLQPGVPAAAHNPRGVEGQAHVKVHERGGGAGDQPRPLRQDRHRRHGGGGLT